MQTKRLDRKKLIMQRRVQRMKVKELEAYLAQKEAQRREIVDEITQVIETLDKEREKLKVLESEN